MMVKMLPLAALTLTLASAVVPAAPHLQPKPRKSEPPNAHQAFLRGNAALTSKNYRTAVVDYTQCLSLGGHGPGISYNRGLAYKKFGMQQSDAVPAFRLAAADFLSAIRGGETRSENYFQLAFTRTAFAPQTALPDWDLAVRLRPDDPDALYNRGVVRAQLGERPAAVQDMRRAAQLYRAIGDAVDAQDALTQLITDKHP
jgi:tetratricopeptide (TPR) repeat protein